MSSLGTLCGGCFRVYEEVNMGLDDTHVVGARKHRSLQIVPQSSCLTQERVTDTTRSLVTIFNRIQILFL